MLSALPQPDPDYKLNRMVLRGDVADPSNRPSGCCFHPRCEYAKKVCETDEPLLVNIIEQGEEHQVACHFAKELELKGVMDHQIES